MDGLGCRWLSRRPDGADVIISGRDGQAMLGSRAFSPLLAEISYGCCQPVGQADLDVTIFFSYRATPATFQITPDVKLKLEQGTAQFGTGFCMMHGSFTMVWEHINI